MFKIVIFLSFCVCISYSDSSFLASLHKCPLKDFECRKNHYDSTLNIIAEHGVPEFNIPGLDPMHVKNQTVSVVGLVDVTLINGVVEGLKSCKLEGFDADIDKLITKIDVFCDFGSIKGAYKVKSASLIEFVIGNVVSGDGTGSIFMENVKVHFDYPFTVEKHDDGEIYLCPELEKSKYSYEVGKVTFEADHVDFGGKEIAPMITSFLNKNWKYVINTFGRFFSDKGLSLSYENMRQFFNSVPAKEYVTDDLEPYVGRYIRFESNVMNFTKNTM